MKERLALLVDMLDEMNRNSNLVNKFVERVAKYNQENAREFVEAIRKKDSVVFMHGVNVGFALTKSVVEEWVGMCSEHNSEPNQIVGLDGTESSCTVKGQINE